MVALNKRVLLLVVLIVCIACVVTALFMSKKFIKKKNMQERFEVVRVIETMQGPLHISVCCVRPKGMN